MLSTIAGWLFYLGGLSALALSLPGSAFDSRHAHFWLALGTIGIWRYSLGAIHFLRAMYFQHIVFPRARRAAAAIPPTPAPMTRIEGVFIFIGWVEPGEGGRDVENGKPA